MKNWTDFAAREDAVWDFCKRMRTNPRERERCKTDNAYARTCFAKGWFYLAEDPNADPALEAIPTDIEFRVFDSTEKGKIEKLVTLVLPPDGAQLPLNSRPTKPAEDVWRCTWFPYATAQAMQKAPK